MPESKSRIKKLILKRVSLTFFFCLVSGLAFSQTQLPISSATASSYYYIYTPSKTIDNNLSTYWRGASFKAYWWLKLDLGKTSTLNQISIWWNNEHTSTNYNIQASNDNTNWTEFYTNLSSVPPDKTNPYLVTYALSGSYRYIRLYLNQAQSSYPVIYEVKLYGSSTTDTTPPTTPVVTDDGSTQTSTTQLHASWTSSDPESGIAEYQYKITQDSTSGTTIVDWTSTGTTNSVTKTGLSLTLNKTYYFSVKAKNGAGLWSNIGYSDGITVITSTDTTPPEVSITQPANGATILGIVTITASATDNIGISKVEFYIDDSLKSTSTTSPYTYSWDTTNYSNTLHTLKAIAYDTSNNIAQAQITVTVNNPTSTELKITSATASSYYYIYTPSKTIDNNLSTYWRGASFKAYWWLKLDLGKTSTLNQISIWWRNAYGSTNYNIQASNDNTNWTELYTGLSSVAPDKTNPYKQTFTLSGAYRYVRLYINKAQKYYPIVYEVKLYGYTQPNNLPQIESIIPLDNSTFLAGAKIDIQVTASDPDNDPLEYQFSIGGTIKQVWSSSNAYTWQTTSADTGYVNITCEVRDNKGGQDTKTITYQIINPSVQEILQKVSDNYALIYDFKADMTLSSTLNGQPFGETEYCRYYFKAPNKEKTESFTDSYRTTKTEVIIIDGSNMYLIDTVNRVIQQVDLLTEAGITGAQFNQMDIYYNLTNFLNNHTVTKNNTNTDFINLIIALDAIPRITNNLYSKLELYIDYNKGLVIKSLLYKDNNLLQTIEVIETQQMPNGAWSPKQINKIPVLTSGNLIDTAIYSNLQINVGLTDLDFDPSKQ